jgi:hypothetical protein
MCFIILGYLADKQDTIMAEYKKEKGPSLMELLIVMNDTISPDSRTIITLSLLAPPLLDPQPMAAANQMAAVPEPSLNRGAAQAIAAGDFEHLPPLRAPEIKSVRSFYFPLLHNHRVQVQSSPSVSVCLLAESLNCTYPLESVSLSNFRVFNCTV